MALYKNLCGETSKIGYTCKVSPSDPRSFVYANAGDNNILGIITQSVPRYAQCEIATSGIAKVFCFENVVQGSIVRAQKVGDRISRGTCKIARLSDVSYFKIGTALESGKGLIRCQLSLGYNSSGSVQNETTIITSSPYTVTETDAFIVVNSATAVTVNLTASTGLGRQLSIASIGVGVVTADANGTDTIDGETTQEIDQWDTMVIKDYAMGFWKID